NSEAGTPFTLTCRPPNCKGNGNDVEVCGVSIGKPVPFKATLPPGLQAFVIKRPARSLRISMPLEFSLELVSLAVAVCAVLIAALVVAVAPDGGAAPVGVTIPD